MSTGLFRGRRRARGRGEGLIEGAQKALGPMSEIIAHKHLEIVCMALAPLLQGHRKCAVDGIADAFRVVWVNQ